MKFSISPVRKEVSTSPARIEVMPMPGGFGDSTSVAENPELPPILEAIRPAVEEKLGATFTLFEGVEFSTQVVAGINYLVKVNVGDNEVVHVKVISSFIVPNASLVALLKCKPAHLSFSKVHEPFLACI